MSCRTAPLLVLLIGALACTSAGEAPTASAPDASVVEDAAIPDTALPPTDAMSDAVRDGDGDEDVVVTEADADAGEYCPHPWFPPRTDGCPCRPPYGPCTELGKVCEYFGPCPNYAYRHTCTDVKPSEGDVERKWVGLDIPCSDAGTVSDAGAD